MFLPSLIDNDDTFFEDFSFLVFELFILKLYNSRERELPVFCGEGTAKAHSLLTVNGGLGFPKHDFQTPPLRVKILLLRAELSS
jgi:hypothetical protein